MVVIDMWYGDLASKAEKIDIAFYPNEGKYRGNIYKGGRIVGVIDFSGQGRNKYGK